MAMKPVYFILKAVLYVLSALMALKVFDYCLSLILSKISIKDELRKELIFGFEARLPIAIVIGFSGHRHQVMPLM